MYDSSLTLSKKGIIVKIDVDVNDTLFEPGVDYLHKNFTVLFNSFQHEMLRLFLEKVFETEKLQCIEFFQGNSFYQLKCIVSQQDEAICIITNNTKQGNILKDLGNHNLKTIFDNYSDWVWSFDTNFTLVTANKGYLEVRKRINKNSINIGDNIFKNAGEQAYKKWMPVYERALKGEIINFEEKRDIEGKEYYVEIYLSPVYNGNSEIIGCLGLTRDITERKLSQQAIASYAEKLEEFAIKTSHELRRPIANIMGMMNLLMNKDLQGVEMDKTIDYLSTSINDLDAIVISMIELMEQHKIKAG
jgi:PAS domain S-box-containing protein